MPWQQANVTLRLPSKTQEPVTYLLAQLNYVISFKQLLEVDGVAGQIGVPVTEGAQ